MASNPIRDRIKEFRRVKASELHPAPHNWREHSDQQRDALRGILAEIGYAEALIARERKDGRLELVNGHLRAETTPDMEVPVLILDVSAEEAAILLATMDPIGQMAEANTAALAKLLEGQEPQDANLRELLEDLAPETIEAIAGSGDKPRAGTEGEDRMPLRPHEHYDYVLVLARTTQEWARLVELLGLEPITTRGKIGLGRGYPAEKLIAKLEEKPDGKPPNRRSKSKARQ